MKSPEAKCEPKENMLDPDTSIWRYMGLHEYLTFVVDRRLMFRQFKDLESSDRREGKRPDDFWESFKRAKRRSPLQGNSDYLAEERRLDDFLHYNYVSCWNRAREEKSLMWTSYAPRGVAIKTTIGKLKEARFENTDQFGTLNYCEITYADSWCELEALGCEHYGIVQNRLFLYVKRKLFVDENEVRFRIQPFPTCKADTYKERRPPHEPKLWPKWFPVIAKDLSWIDEVVADSAIAPWSIDTLLELSSSHGLRFQQSGR